MANKIKYQNRLKMKDAEKARDAITASQKKEIAKLYEKWADEIKAKAEMFKHKTTPSSVVSEKQMKELEKMLKATSQKVSNEVYNKIKENIFRIASSVIETDREWLKSLGFYFGDKGFNALFNNVPDSIVRKLVTGQIYDSGWSLSKAIWGDNEATLSHLYEIVAGGVAKNQSIYEIAKDIEKVVRPSAKKPWNLTDKDGRKIYPRQVDYSSQRLARTLVQHGYQQSFTETTKDNPFITEYIWRSNGSRVCEICKARDGKRFKKDELPLDHPNGMCTMEPAVSKTMVDDIANWYNSPDGTYPDIDKFAKKLGYDGSGKAAEPEKKEESKHNIVDGKDITDEWQRRKGEFDFIIEDVINAQGFDGMPRIVNAEEFDKLVKESKFIAQRSYSAPSKEILDAYEDQLYNGKRYVDCSTGGAQYGKGMYCAADYTGTLTDGIKEEMKHYKDLGQKKIAGSDIAWRNYFDNLKLSDIPQINISEDELEALKMINGTAELKFSDLDEKYKDIMRNLINDDKRSDVVRSELDNLQINFEKTFVVPSKTETFTLDKSAKIITYSEIKNKFRFEGGAEKFGNSMDLGSYAALLGYDAINAEGHGASGSYTVILNRTKLIIKGGK